MFFQTAANHAHWLFGDVLGGVTPLVKQQNPARTPRESHIICFLLPFAFWIMKSKNQKWGGTTYWKHHHFHSFLGITCVELTLGAQMLTPQGNRSMPDKWSIYFLRKTFGVANTNLHNLHRYWGGGGKSPSHSTRNLPRPDRLGSQNEMTAKSGSEPLNFRQIETFFWESETLFALPPPTSQESLCQIILLVALCWLKDAHRVLE